MALPHFRLGSRLSVVVSISLVLSLASDLGLRAVLKLGGFLIYCFSFFRLNSEQAENVSVEEAVVVGGPAQEPDVEKLSDRDRIQELDVEQLLKGDLIEKPNVEQLPDHDRVPEPLVDQLLNDDLIEEPVVEQLPDRDRIQEPMVGQLLNDDLIEKSDVENLPLDKWVQRPEKGVSYFCLFFCF